MKKKEPKKRTLPALAPAPVNDIHGNTFDFTTSVRIAHDGRSTTLRLIDDEARWASSAFERLKLDMQRAAPGHSNGFDTAQQLALHAVKLSGLLNRLGAQNECLRRLSLLPDAKKNWPGGIEVTVAALSPTPARRAES